MAHHPSTILCIFSLLTLSLSSLVSSSSSQENDIKPKFNSIVLPLYKYRKTKFDNVWGQLNHIAGISLLRADNLKFPNQTKRKVTPLYPKSYGEYTIDLNFGTPPQPLSFILDTGSEPIWFPCTRQYECVNCNSTPVDDPNQLINPNIPTFDPTISSSSKKSGCNDNICHWLHRGDNDLSGCKDTCPPYQIEYGSGFTSGTLLSETLHFENVDTPNVFVGCSNLTAMVYTGIVGFGRGPPSLPSQLSLRKFSYCLLSRNYNDTSKSSPLVLYGSSESDDEISDGLCTTPMLKGSDAYSMYYYVAMEKISVGGKELDMPEDFLSLRSDGNGGTIVDSGTTFTFMDKRIFDLLAKAIESHFTYPRVTDLEESTKLKRCYELPKNGIFSLPNITVHFKEGVRMDLPVENSFWIVDNGATKVACLAFVTGTDEGGPSIIYGNFQQQNYYLEFDIKNDRFGFRPNDCSTFHSEEVSNQASSRSVSVGN